MSLINVRLAPYPTSPVGAGFATPVWCGFVTTNHGQRLVPEGQRVLDGRDIVVVPDILANAGGVTASYFEWAQARQGYPWPDNLVAERLRERMDHAFTEVWARAQSLGVSMRLAAFVVAVERVAAAHEARGLFP